jgi:hypothetical protein
MPRGGIAPKGWEDWYHLVNKVVGNPDITVKANTLKRLLDELAKSEERIQCRTEKE